jgi:hypothetical protein
MKTLFYIFFLLFSFVSANSQSSEINSIQELETVWKKNISTLDGSKNSSFKRIEILAALFKKTNSAVIETEKARILAENYYWVDIDGKTFDRYFLSALIVESLSNKDELLSVISAKCPPKLEQIPIEFYFANKSLDNLNIFFNAYSEAKTNDAKFWLRFVLRRIFRRQSKLYSNDEKFIASSQKWFEKNRKNLAVNPYYRTSVVEFEKELRRWFETFKPTLKLKPPPKFRRTESQANLNLLLLKNTR